MRGDKYCEGKFGIAHNADHFVFVSWKRATEVSCFVHRWKVRPCDFLGGLYGPLKSFLLCLCGVAGCCLWRHPYVAVLYRPGSEGTDESSLPEQSDQLKTLLGCPPPRCGRRF